MKLFLEIGIALLVCGAVFWLIRAAKGSLFAPLPAGRDLCLRVTVRAKGDAPSLEQALRGLRWLAGDTRLELEVADTGLTPEAARRAALLAAQFGAVLKRPGADT